MENRGVGNAENAFVDNTLMRGRVAERLSQRKDMTQCVVGRRKVLIRGTTAVVVTIVIVQSDGKWNDCKRSDSDCKRLKQLNLFGIIRD